MEKGRGSNRRPVETRRGGNEPSSNRGGTETRVRVCVRVRVVERMQPGLKRHKIITRTTRRAAIGRMCSPMRV